MAKEYLIGDFLRRIKRPVNLIDNQEYKLVTIKMNHKGIVLRELKKGALIKSKMFEVKKGDFILSGIDARNGAFGIVPPELDGAIVTNDFWYFEIDESIISKRLFLELTATTWFDEICKKGSDGTTQRIRLQKDKFFNQCIWLPESNEQEIILEKLSSFKKGKSLLNSEIVYQKHLLSQLKQAILQEAIQGQLTAAWRKQNPDVEPASDLLKRIKAEKAQLIKEKKIKKEKPLPPITQEEIPFEIPENWVWCRGYYVAKYIDPQPSHRTPPVSKDGIPYVSMKDISKEGLINLNSARKVGKNILEEHRNRYLLEKDDFIFGKIGTIGNPVWLSEPFNYTLSANLILIQANREILNPKYFFYFLSSPYALSHLKDSKSEMSYPVFGMKKARLMPVILPPIEEQNAIVEKVERLMQKCDALEQEITQSEQHANMLMQAVLKEAFEDR